jgi:hypothetical protein
VVLRGHRLGKIERDAQRVPLFALWQFPYPFKHLWGFLHFFTTRAIPESQTCIAQFDFYAVSVRSEELALRSTVQKDHPSLNRDPKEQRSRSFSFAF